MLADEILVELQEIKKLLRVIAMSPKYWEYKPIRTDTLYVIPAGGKSTVLDIKETGKLIAIVAITNNPDVYVVLSFDGERMGKTLRELYESGFTSYNPAYFWIVKWDEQNNRYIAAFTPAEPIMYFGHFEFTVYAPRDSPATVSYVVHRYRLKEVI